ncbi:MAG: LPXTG cell wall anchor domain-containing protein [Clostridia bacterium]|nr:LPXTG cell wall anchor domain-containing protein [Clostridia bacterium]
MDKLWRNEDLPEKLLEKIKTLKASLGGVSATKIPGIPKEAGNMIDWLIHFADSAGLEYWIKARKLVTQAETGFDILVTDDGTDWKKITGDGLRDRYNYGARTFTLFNGELYVGTANPYYGAQLWKLRNVTAPLPVPKTGDSGNPLLWAGLILLGLLGLVAAGWMIRSRRNRQKKKE